MHRLYLVLVVALIIILAVLAGLTLDTPTLENQILIALATGFLGLATVSDIKTLRIPNKLNLFFGIAMFVAALIVILITTDKNLEGDLVRAVLIAIFTMTGFLIIHLIHPKGLGMGDVKLAFGLGMFLGWFSLEALLMGLLSAFFINAISALIVISVSVLSGKKSSVLPFAPALSMGAFLGLILI